MQDAETEACDLEVDYFTFTFFFTPHLFSMGINWTAGTSVYI